MYRAAAVILAGVICSGVAVLTVAPVEDPPDDEAAAADKLVKASRKVKTASTGLVAQNQVAGKSCEDAQTRRKAVELVYEQTVREFYEISNETRTAPPTYSEAGYRAEVATWKRSYVAARAAVANAEFAAVDLAKLIDAESVRIERWRDKWGGLGSFRSLENFLDFARRQMREYDGYREGIMSMTEPPSYPDAIPSRRTIRVTDWRRPPEEMDPGQPYTTSVRFTNTNPDWTVEIEASIGVGGPIQFVHPETQTQTVTLAPNRWVIVSWEIVHNGKPDEVGRLHPPQRRIVRAYR